jgi:hypothetical protein
MGLNEELYSVVITAREMAYILIIIAILLIIIIALIVFEQRLKRVLRMHKESRNLFYRNKVRELRMEPGSPQEKLEKINETAREYFKEAFNMPLNTGYLELVEEFRKRNNELCERFCRMISGLNYSGEIVDEYVVDELLTMLKRIVEENEIHSKEEDLVLKQLKEEKNMKQNNFIRRPQEQIKTSIKPNNYFNDSIGNQIRPELKDRLDLRSKNPKEETEDEENKEDNE